MCAQILSRGGPGRTDRAALLEPLPFFEGFKHYLQVEVVAATKEDFDLWEGWVGSRMRLLIKVCGGGGDSSRGWDVGMLGVGGGPGASLSWAVRTANGCVLPASCLLLSLLAERRHDGGCAALAQGLPPAASTGSRASGGTGRPGRWRGGGGGRCAAAGAAALPVLHGP